MQLLTKFWKTKLLTLVASIAGTVGIWGALAWDDWTVHRVTAEEEMRGALLYLAANPAPTVAPEPTAPAPLVRVVQPVEVHRVVVVTRRVEGPAGGDAPPPASPVEPPVQVVAPTPVAAAPTKRTTSTKPVQQPAPSEPPPAPAPEPAPAPKPAPTPVPSKGS